MVKNKTDKKASSDQSPPTYQDVIDGRIEIHTVDPKMHPLQDGAVSAKPTESHLPDPVVICGK